MLPRLKGIYRHFWVRNQMILAGKGALLGALEEAGIPTLMLKGAALTAVVYRDGGVRPMNDFDVLVPEHRALPAMEILEKRGWIPEFHDHRALVASLHACHFRHPREGNLDLHWRVMHAASRRAGDDLFWKRSVPLEWQGVRTRVLSTEDQLLHACEHGPRFDLVPPLRWLADVWCTVRTSEGAVDWERLRSGARLRKLILPVRDSLVWLERHIGPVLPDPERELWRAERPGYFERVETRLARRPFPADPPWWHKLPLNLCLYWRLRGGDNWMVFWRGLPLFLRHIHNLRRPFHEHVAKRALMAAKQVLRRFVRGEQPDQPEGDRGIRSVPAHDFTGFGPLERCGDEWVRWSGERGVLRVRLPRLPGRIVLHLGKPCDWSGDLEPHTAFYFNTHPLPPAAVRYDAARHAVMLAVGPEWFEDEVYQRIGIRCAVSAGGQGRGLPLAGVGTEGFRPDQA